MIVVVTPTDETWEFNDYLQTLGKELLGRVKILTCDEIAVHQKVPLASYVFMAIDQMSPTEKEIATQCWEGLSETRSEIKLINHPARVLLRHNLLKLCFERGRNSFRVYRASEFLHCRRFPVFLRRNLDHNGSVTPLLYTRGELGRALAKSLYLGYRLRDLIIVEYCDTADPSGTFRKYSAFIVGDRVLPHTLMHSTLWITKSQGRLIDASTAREEIEYVRNNPHGQWLRETFALAKISYGRIDYGLRDGKPQLWEINTNPTIIRTAGADPISEEQRRLRDPVRLQFFPAFQSALEAIDAGTDPSEMVRINVSPRQQRNLKIEKELRLRVQARKTVISRSARFLIRSLRHLRGSM
jgi:hypothetical protein